MTWDNLNYRRITLRNKKKKKPSHYTWDYKRKSTRYLQLDLKIKKDRRNYRGITCNYNQEYNGMGLYSDYIWFKVIIYLGIQLFTMASIGDTMDNQKKVCSLGNCQLSHNFNGLCVEFCDLLMHQHATFILNIFNFHMKGDVTGWIRWFYFWRFFILPRCFHKKMTGTVTYQ